MSEDLSGGYFNGCEFNFNRGRIEKHSSISPPLQSVEQKKELNLEEINPWDFPREIEHSQYGIRIVRPLSARSKAEQGISYANAKYEIVLLPSAGGSALHRSHERYQENTSDNIWHILETRAEEGVSIKIFIVDPRKIKGDPRLIKYEKNITEEAIKTIEQAIEFNKRIKDTNVRRARPMQVKLLDHLPNFSADLIDTDIEKSAEYYKKVDTSEISIIQKTFEARSAISYMCTFEDIGEYFSNTSKKHPSPNGKIKAPFFHYREIMYEEWKSDKNITVTQENWNIIKNDVSDQKQQVVQTMPSIKGVNQNLNVNSIWYKNPAITGVVGVILGAATTAAVYSIMG